MDDQCIARVVVNRLNAIRAEAIKPTRKRRRDFDLDWQLSCLVDEIERSCGLRSTNLDATTPTGGR